MKQKNLGIIIIAIVVIAVGVYFLKNRSTDDSKSAGTQNISDGATMELATQDLQAFKQALFTDARQLKNQNLAMDCSENKDTVIRSICAEALGFFDNNQSMMQIENLLKDSSLQVRRAAVRGLTRSPGPERENVILARLQTLGEGDEDIAEQIELYAALGKIGEEKNRDLSIEWLVFYAKKGNSSRHLTAMRRAASLQPTADSVIDLTRAKLQGKNPAAMEFSIMHLSAIKDSEIKGKLKKYISDSNPRIRMATVNGMALACDPDIWDYLSKLLKTESNQRVITAAIGAPLKVLGAKSVAFLEQVIEQNILPDSLKDQAEKNLEFTKTNIKNGRCE